MFKHYEHLLRVTAGRPDTRNLQLRIYREIGLLAVSDALNICEGAEKNLSVDYLPHRDKTAPQANIAA